MAEVCLSSQHPLSADEIARDRKTVKRYDQCGLGKKGIYVPGKMRPRKYCIPYEAVTHVFRRVAVSPGSGKAFLTPILYIVIRYDNGKESQNLFRYMDDADKMLKQLSDEHPEISQLSPEGERKKAEQEKREAELQSGELSSSAARAKGKLVRAKEKLEKRPGLSDRLAGVARVKRRIDLIKPGYTALAVGLLAGGAVLVLIGFLLALSGDRSSRTILILLIGFALLFIMGNSKVLPTRKKNKKALQKDYDKAIRDMTAYLAEGEEKFPIDPHYAHPYTCDRLIRILEEHRAENIDDAMAILKEDLKSMDSSVALSGDDYKQVVTIKPLFTVCGYQYE